MRTSLDPDAAGSRGEGAARRPGPLRSRAGLARRDRHTSLLGEGWAERLAGVNLAPAMPTGARPSCSRARARTSRSASTTARPATLLGVARHARSALAAGSAFDMLRTGDVIPVTKVGPKAAHLRAAPDPARLGRHRRRGPAHRAASWRWSAASTPRSSVQPRHAGAAPAGLDVQADRLCGRARQRHDPGDDRRRRPFCVFQTTRLGHKCFRNFGGGYAGPQTMRWGVEQSRNLMTVRTAAHIGMDKVVAHAKALGVGDYPPSSRSRSARATPPSSGWSTPTRHARSTPGGRRSRR